MRKPLISIVLVEPEGPDNIGSVARAMKNMGLYDLRLVRPPLGWREKAKKMAMAAGDILREASVYPSLEKAVGDVSVVIGTTRRRGAKRGTFVAFAETIRKIKRISERKPVAIVFGKESEGLDNSSLKICDWITTIPASPVYPSLNLAQAVMLVAFELFRSHYKNVKQSGDVPEFSYVSKETVQDVLQRFKKALLVLDYEEEGLGVVNRILETLYGMIKRNGLLESEAQMLKGLSRRICEKMFEKS